MKDTLNVSIVYSKLKPYFSKSSYLEYELLGQVVVLII